MDILKQLLNINWNYKSFKGCCISKGTRRKRVTIHITFGWIRSFKSMRGMVDYSDHIHVKALENSKQRWQTSEKLEASCLPRGMLSAEPGHRDLTADLLVRQDDSLHTGWWRNPTSLSSRWQLLYHQPPCDSKSLSHIWELTDEQFGKLFQCHRWFPPLTDQCPCHINVQTLWLSAFSM